MPAIQENAARPTIHIYHAPDAPAQLLHQLQYGMEEEGIPWEVETRSAAEAVAMAWEASNNSRLGVGVGLDGQFAVLHFSKLAPGAPLFALPVRSALEQVRALGSNAGRLVKKLPLKSLHGR